MNDLKEIKISQYISMNREAILWYDSAMKLSESTISEVETVVSSMLAYSAELSLKTILLIINNHFKQTHNLKNLFESVPAELRQSIEDNVYFDYSALSHFITGQIIYQPLNFKDVLESFSNDFIDKRYIHEELMSIDG